MLMDGLLIATGFTGALTLAWLIRLCIRAFSSGSGVAVQFGPAAAEAIAEQLSKARREIVLVGLDAVSAVARPLADARARGVNIDALLDPDGDRLPLERAGVTIRPTSRPTPPGLVVVIDDRIVLIVGPGAEADTLGQVVVAHGPEALVQSCRQHFAAFHPVGQVSAPPQPAPAPQRVAPPVIQPAPRAVVVPAPAPMPAPAPVVVPVSAPTPVVASLPSYITPVSSPVDDLLAAVARGTSTVQDEDEEEIEEDDPTAPPVTTATAELFARLRQEAALSAQADSEEHAA